MMEVIISEDKFQLGRSAAIKGAQIIREVISIKGEANIIIGTGTSQLEMLGELIKQNIDWTKVRVFHLDEYIGMSKNHPASFRKFLKERFTDKIPLKEVIYVNGESDPYNECNRLENLINKNPIDISFIGIGENGHLAFNDPPADFETEKSFIVVNLDKSCRQQQLNEGWFESLDMVPKSAISISIKGILKSDKIICTTPEDRKAKAVRNTLQKDISNLFPSTIMNYHKDIWLFLDKDSSSLLTN